MIRDPWWMLRLSLHLTKLVQMRSTHGLTLGLHLVLFIQLWLIIVVPLLGCRRSSSFHHHRGNHEKESKRVINDSSHRVAEDDDPMDCDCEIEEEVIGSKKKVLSRRLPSSSHASSLSSEGEGESLAWCGIHGRRKNACRCCWPEQLDALGWLLWSVFRRYPYLGSGHDSSNGGKLWSEFWVWMGIFVGAPHRSAVGFSVQSDWENGASLYKGRAAGSSQWHHSHCFEHLIA